MKARTTPQWGRIPAELRERTQWLLASPDAKGDLKIPTSLDNVGMPKSGSSTDPSTWLTFDVACAAAWHYGLGIGYVLSKDDPFTCIDLDVKNATNERDPSKWTPSEVIQSHAMVMDVFGSYTERSQSGQGLHIWVVGKIADDDGKGAKRNFTEAYCQARFMVCTGDIVLDKPIRADEQVQPMIDALVARIREGQKDSKIELVELDEEFSDAEIVEALTSQTNGDKYVELCKGDWAGMGFPSQSEADLALLSMLAYRSVSNEQCRRLFRYSALGKRDKAIKNDVYLNRTLAIIRARQAREAAAEQHGAAVAEAMMQSLTLGAPEPVAAPGPAPTHVAPAGPLRTTSLDWPPGFAGAVARFIYNSSPRPVREVAIVSTLGLLAGICGRCWNIPNSGLNMYIVLIARSAVGKEAMHGGISKLVAQMSQHGPGGNAIQQFVDFSKHASGPALLKAVAMNQSFVNISGEWGKTLAAMSADEGKLNGPLASLRTVMTDLYQKSAFGSIVGGMTYSDKDKNVASVSGVAYSMIGETTPSTFYESLTDSMMADGFLSRFTLIEYDGDRPEINYSPQEKLEEQYANHLMLLTNRAKSLIHGRGVINLQPCPEAIEMMHRFNLECDMNINMARDDEAVRQMHNRAHLKGLRLSSLLAAADDPANDHPVVYPHHVEWALKVVRNDITIMTRRLREGDVGISDYSREMKLRSYFSEYLTQNIPDSYGIPLSLKLAGIIPRKYLQVRSQRTPAFTQHKLGATKGLDDTLRSMIDSGYLAEVSKDKLATEYSFHGKAYRILDMSKSFGR